MGTVLAGTQTRKNNPSAPPLGSSRSIAEKGETGANKKMTTEWVMSATVEAPMKKGKTQKRAQLPPGEGRIREGLL